MVSGFEAREGTSYTKLDRNARRKSRIKPQSIGGQFGRGLVTICPICEIVIKPTFSGMILPSRSGGRLRETWERACNKAGNQSPPPNRLLKA